MHRGLLLVLALVLAMPAAANAETVSQTLRKFGLLGTWADDCSRPAANDNFHTVYAALPNGHVQRTYYNAPGKIYNQYVLQRVNRVSADQLFYSQKGSAGRIDVVLLRSQLPLKPYHFYICGPTPMMESLVPALEDWGVPDARIHFEAFGPASIKRRNVPELFRGAFLNVAARNIPFFRLYNNQRNVSQTIDYALIFFPSKIYRLFHQVTSSNRPSWVVAAESALRAGSFLSPALSFSRKFRAILRTRGNSASRCAS